MAETEALAKFRADVPPTVRNRVTADTVRWAIRDVINTDSPDGGYRAPEKDDPRRHTWPGEDLNTPVASAAPAAEQTEHY